MLTFFGLEMLLVAVIDQRIQPRHTFRDHAAATPAIATVRPAVRNKFFTPEAHAAFTAIAAANIYFSFIKEFHGFLLLVLSVRMARAYIVEVEIVAFTSGGFVDGIGPAINAGIINLAPLIRPRLI
jgi:hypothetical protein